MKKSIMIIVILISFSCGDSVYKKFQQAVSFWEQREILFPADVTFVSYGRKFGEREMQLEEGEYTIFSYVDSTGCMSCKLQLDKWTEFIHIVDSISCGEVPFVFVFQSKKKNDLINFLKKTGFEYPLFIDTEDYFDRLNKFPLDMRLQTFLLDRNNKVVAIGNPIYNPEIKDLYLKIIQGKALDSDKDVVQTQVALPEASFTFGDFPWQEEQIHSFEVKNTGNKPLVIQDVTTSCGCITVDFTKEPVQPGGTAVVTVTYKADRPEYFNKTVTVYGNAEQLPFSWHVSGSAK